MNKTTIKVIESFIDKTTLKVIIVYNTDNTPRLQYNEFGKFFTYQGEFLEFTTLEDLLEFIELIESKDYYITGITYGSHILSIPDSKVLYVKLEKQEL